MASSRHRREGPRVTKFLAALAFLGLNFYVYHFFATSETIPPRASFNTFPRDLGPWHCAQATEMEDVVLANLGVTDYLLCSYRTDAAGVPIDVYVGYHETQVRREGGGDKQNSIHPPRHCLPGSGWSIMSHERRALELPALPQRPAFVNRLVIAKGEHRALVYYWYQSRGRVIAEDWKKIVLMSLDRASAGRTDGSLVRFTAPIVGDDVAGAEERLLDLAGFVTTRLAAYVPE
jgi:EpsI family protein